MKLAATKRTPGNNRSLRADGRLPAVVYNQQFNVSVAIDTKAFDKVFREQGTSSLIDLDVEGDAHQVLVREVQMDKRRRVPVHIDFYAITKGQKLEVYVPVHFEGTSQGQNEGGQLDVQRREVGIYVLPSEIPHELTVDITALEIGDSVHIADVVSQLPETAELLDDEGLTLVTVLAPRVEEEPEPSEDEEAEPEVIGRGGEDEEGEGDEDAKRGGDADEED
ncbi:MAG: 50S ribosomal protein L25 [Trueperaceae bacterium]|nr:50S ribosomal protein L25 [Trueperaceae bacterium]